MTAAKTILMVVLVIAAPSLASAASVYETNAEFIDRGYNGSPPEPAVVWLSGETKTRVHEILGHNYPALRVRYWCKAGRSAWILDEIGKELPITVGVIINQQYISNLSVLVYRENRGEEVATPAFTDQFEHRSLADDGSLDQSIDGITGATLSVQALTRLASMALYLHSVSGCYDG